MYNKKLSVNSIKFSDLLSPLKGGTAMKKHIKEITALLICAAMLTACGNNGGTPASAPAESTSAQPAASPVSETGESVTKAETTLSETGSELPEENGYRIFVRNEKGDPVNGVLLQFCSDSECVLGETDTDGIAVFDYPDGAYTVHILKAPAGYADDENEYPAPASRGTVEIMLKTDTPDKETEWQNIDELDFTKPVMDPGQFLFDDLLHPFQGFLYIHSKMNGGSVDLIRRQDHIILKIIISDNGHLAEPFDPGGADADALYGSVPAVKTHKIPHLDCPLKGHDNAGEDIRYDILTADTEDHPCHPGGDA